MRRELEELGVRVVEILRQDPDASVSESMKQVAPRNMIIKANEPLIIDRLARGEIVVLFDTISPEDLDSFVPIAVQLTPQKLKSEIFVVVLYSEPEADVDALTREDLECLLSFNSPSDARDWLLSR